MLDEVRRKIRSPVNVRFFLNSIQSMTKPLKALCWQRENREASSNTRYQ